MVHEFVLAVGPKIIDEVPEFSFEVIFNSGKASSFSEIRCETDTFPPAEVSWVLVNGEYPCAEEECGVNVASLNSTFSVNFIDSGNEQNLTRSLDAILELLNLQYDQDGNFTCTADNGHFSATRSFNLRVKCMSVGRV